MRQLFSGMTKSDVANQLENIGLAALVYFATRSHMTGELVNLLASLIGLGATMASNALTVRNGGSGKGSALPNGAAQ